MRILYTLIWTLALPIALVRLWWRGRAEPNYRRHILERLGYYKKQSVKMHGVIWVHAVSVGETQAAAPLIQQLLLDYPHQTILLSHMTPTGRATGATLFGTDQLVQCYLPYDIPRLIQRLLTHFDPKICILMETEVWPNLIHTCKKNNVPIVLLNARLSPRSYNKAMRLPRLILPACAAITCVAAQTEADAQRIRQLGAPRVVVTGNIKFDVEPQTAQCQAGRQLRQQIGPRPVLICASTREGEEQLILAAFIKAQQTKFHASGNVPSLWSTMLLIIVPRHPQRFDAVAEKINSTGLRMIRRSQLGNAALDSTTQVMLGDSMGEMTCYYSCADIAFIGGSLLPLGGQNLIEACAVQKPVLIGPHTFNFDVVTHDAITAHAAIRVDDADALMAQTISLISDSIQRDAIGHNALAFAIQHRGATQRTCHLLREWIS